MQNSKWWTERHNCWQWHD